MKYLVLFSLIVSLHSCSLFKKNYTPEQKAEISKKLNKFFADKFEESVSRYPTWQTYLGRKTNYDKLDNNTEEYALEDFERSKKTLDELEDFDRDALNEQDRLSYDIFKINLEKGIEGFKWRFHYFPLNQMFGYHSRTPAFLINMHQIENVEHAKAYISRLREIKRVFGENLTNLKIQEDKGILPPKFVFPKIYSDSKNIITGAPFAKGKKDSPLLQDFKKKISRLKIKRKVKNQLIKDAKAALLDSIKPAYEELLAYARHLDSKTKDNHGAWSLPNGDEFYNFRLKSITTTDMKSDEIHELGLKEVDRIHKEMEEIKKKVNFKGDLKEFFKYMRTSKKFLYPQSKKGRNSYLRDAKKVVADIEKRLPEMFNTFPKADLIIKPVEAYREKSAGIAFYQGPSLEGNRPGTYYVNLYKMADNPKYKLEALAYHEAIPGHHMQIAIATELEGLPKFRRMGGFTAYSEGWGLYSEFLPKEYGFYKDPYSDFGRLSMELWRACRLVVDSGIHAKKWTREESIQYLKDNTPNAELEIVKGIERYFIMPAQATAYKIGMIKILELREMARAELKEKFDIREFHDVVLRGGSIPLYVLEDQVNKWIESKSL